MEELLKSLQWRYAVKQFDPGKKLSDEQLHLAKESLRMAPSSFGLQLWKFLNIENVETRIKLKEKAWGQSQVVDASHLFILCRPESCGPEDVETFLNATADTRNMPIETLDFYKKMLLGFMDKFDDTQKAYWMEKQIYLALGTLLTACAQAKIDACPLEGFEHEAVDEVLGLSKRGLRSVVLCTLGFRTDTDKYATLPKVRYPESVVFESI